MERTYDTKACNNLYLKNNIIHICFIWKSNVSKSSLAADNHLPTSGTAPGLYLGTYKGYDEQVRRSSEDILYAGLIWPSVSYLLAFYFLNFLIYLFKGY